jgi:predicted house-cleaning noncanonical NTP pyrophosphatase (MazG superfamily)
LAQTHKKQKLIRDNVGPGNPEHGEYLLKGGAPYNLLMVPTQLQPLLLVGKLHEEAEEIREAMTDPVEYADALQVLMDLAKLNGVPWSEIKFQREMKEMRRGGFLTGRSLLREETIDAK